MKHTKLFAFLQTKAKLYHKNSLQFLLAVCFTGITATAILIIGFSMYFRFAGYLQRQIGEDNRHLLMQVNYNLDSYLRGMMQVSDTLYYTVIKNADLREDSLDEMMNMLYEANQQKIISIGVFSANGNLVCAVPQSRLKPSVNAAEQEWFRSAYGKIENLHFSIPHVQNLFVDPSGKPHWVLSLSRAVELTYNGNIESGILLIDMDFSGIEQVCKNTALGESGYLYIIDQNGTIIYHPNQQLLYAGLFSENNTMSAAYEEGNHIETFNGEERLVTVKAVGYTGWKIVGVMPLADMKTSYYPSSTYVIVFVLLSIALMAMINLFVSSRIAIPIKKLENSVNEIEGGNLNTDISIGGSYEVQHLGKSIRSMQAQIKKLMEDVLHEQEAKRVSELAVLQSQINPHFLYNTLDSIIWMIENEQYDGAITMVTALARLFRISLSRGNSIISVNMELEHARNYLTIQKMRYKNKFNVEIQCSPDASVLSTIKLIVQPLLENAIYHGMEYMDGDGEIKVHAYCKDAQLYIDVSDNGMGMPQETAQSLLLHPSKSHGHGSGVALRNVHERIRLTYGPQYGLEIFSEPDEGTLVRIHLPAVEAST